MQVVFQVSYRISSEALGGILCISNNFKVMCFGKILGDS